MPTGLVVDRLTVDEFKVVVHADSVQSQLAAHPRSTKPYCTEKKSKPTSKIYPKKKLKPTPVDFPDIIRLVPLPCSNLRSGCGSTPDKSKCGSHNGSCNHICSTAIA